MGNSLTKFLTLHMLDQVNLNDSLTFLITILPLNDPYIPRTASFWPTKRKKVFGKWILYPSTVPTFTTTSIPLVISNYWLVLICPIKRTVKYFSFYTVKPRKVSLLLVLHCCFLLQFHRLPNQMLFLLFSVYKNPEKCPHLKEHSP